MIEPGFQKARAQFIRDEHQRLAHRQERLNDDWKQLREEAEKWDLMNLLADLDHLAGR